MVPSGLLPDTSRHHHADRSRHRSRAARAMEPANESMSRMPRKSTCNSPQEWDAMLRDIEDRQALRRAVGKVLDEVRRRKEGVKNLPILKFREGHYEAFEAALHELGVQLADEECKRLGLYPKCDCGGEPHGKYCALVINGLVPFEDHAAENGY